MYLIVLAEDIYDSLDYDLEYQTNDFMNEFSNNNETFKVLDSTYTQINDLPQIQVAFEYSTDDTELTYYMVSIKGNKNAYIILGWTLKELFEYNRNYFYKAVSTFKEEK